MGLVQKLTAPFVMPVLKWVADALLDFAIQLVAKEGAHALAKVAGCFVPVGGPVLGRQYAVTLTLNEQPPKGHPKAWLLAAGNFKGVSFFVWGVSFPKAGWESLGEEQKLHVSVKL